MNKVLEEYYENFIEENDYYEKVYLPNDEQERLNRQVKEGWGSEESPFDKYYYDIASMNTYRFYEKKPIEIIDSELSQFISLKMFELTKSMEQKQNTIKSIMIFWLILTIINLIGSIYWAIKIASLFSKLGRY